MMLEQVGEIFSDMKDMLKKVKKNNYETRMDDFRGKYGHYFDEMVTYTENQEDKEAAAAQIAETFVAAAKEVATVKGKITGRRQVDMNFFMIYYVFPAILLTEHPQAKIVADGICNLWGETFKDSKIGYTSFEQLNGAFRNKIFGIF